MRALLGAVLVFVTKVLAENDFRGDVDLDYFTYFDDEMEPRGGVDNWPELDDEIAAREEEYYRRRRQILINRFPERQTTFSAPPPPSDCPEKCTCRSPEEVHCTFKFLSKVPDGVPDGVEKINLGYNKLNVLPGRSFEKHSATLRFLFLHSNDIKSLNSAVFSKLENIEVIRLSWNKLTGIRKTALHGLHGVERLYLDNNRLSFIHPLAFRGLVNLKLLQLDGNRLSRLHEDLFVTLEFQKYFKFSSIQYLYLSKNSLQNLPQRIFENMQNLKRTYLHANEWDCSCELEWLKNWMDGKQISRCKRNSWNPRKPEECAACAWPPRLEGIRLQDISRFNLTCDAPSLTVRIGPEPALRYIMDLEEIPRQDELAFFRHSGFYSTRMNIRLDSHRSSVFHANCNLTRVPNVRVEEIFKNDEKEVATGAPPGESSSPLYTGYFESGMRCVVEYPDDFSTLRRIFNPYLDRPMNLTLRDTRPIQSGKPQSGYSVSVPNVVAGLTTPITGASVSSDSEFIRSPSSVVTFQSKNINPEQKTIDLALQTSFTHTHTAEAGQYAKQPWTLIKKEKATGMSVEIAIERRTTSLKCRAVGQPKPKITWVLPGDRVLRSGETDGRFSVTRSGRLFIRRSKPDDSGVYRCIAAVTASTESKSTGILTSAEAEMNTIKLDVFSRTKDSEGILSRLHIQTVDEGDEWSSECNVKGVPNITKAWITPTNQLIVGGGKGRDARVTMTKAGKIIVKSFEKSDQGIYRCVTSNILGTAEYSAYVGMRSTDNELIETIEIPSLVLMPDEMLEYDEQDESVLPPILPEVTRPDMEERTTTTRITRSTTPWPYKPSSATAKATKPPQTPVQDPASNIAGATDKVKPIKPPMVAPTSTGTATTVEAGPSWPTQPAIDDLSQPGDEKPRFPSPDRRPSTRDGGEEQTTEPPTTRRRLTDDLAGQDEVGSVLEIKADTTPAPRVTDRAGNVEELRETTAPELNGVALEDNEARSPEKTDEFDLNGGGPVPEDLPTSIAPTIADFPRDPITVKLGGTVTIPCNAEGSPMPELSWKRRGDSRLISSVPRAPTFDSIDVPSVVFVNKPTHVDGHLALIINGATASDSGIYTCSATNGAGVATKDIRVTVGTPDPAPEKVELSIPDIRVGCGEKATCPCALVPKFPASLVLWTIPDGSSIPASSVRENGIIVSRNATLYLSRATSEQSGTYKCEIKNPIGTAFMVVRVMVECATPRIIEPSYSNLVVDHGSSVEVTCRATGSPTPTVSWNSAESLGKSVLSLTRVTGNTTRTCVASNNVGNETFTLKISVRAKKPRIVHGLPASVSSLQGLTVRLNCVADGLPKPSYTWYHPNGSIIDRSGGDAITRMPNGSLLIRKVAESHEGEYRCVAGNHLGTDEMTVTLVVTQPYIPTARTEEIFDSGRKSIDEFDVLPIEEPRNVPKHGTQQPPAVSSPKYGANFTDTPVLHSRKPVVVESQIRQRITFPGSPQRIPAKRPKTTQALKSTIYPDEAAPTKGRKLTLPARLPPTRRHPVRPTGVTMSRKPTLSTRGVIQTRFKLDFPAQRLYRPRTTVYRPAGRLGVKDMPFDLDSSSNYIYRPAHKSRRVYQHSQRTMRVLHGKQVALPCVNFEPRPTARSTSAGPVTFEWTLPSGVSYGYPYSPMPVNPRYLIHANGSLVVRSPSSNDAGIYTCTASRRGDNAEYQTTISVRVESERPHILERLHDYLMPKANLPLSIPCSTRGHPAPTVTWTTPEGTIIGVGSWNDGMTVLRNGTLFIPNIRPESTGRFVCKATNKAGQRRRTVQVHVTSYRPQIRKDPRSRQRNVRLGGSIHLPCDAKGSPPPTFSWVLPNREKIVKNQAIFKGRLRSPKFAVLPTGTLVVNRATFNDIGTYLCTAENSIGRDISWVTLRVYE